MKNYILAIDEGTTSTRAILFDREMRMVSTSQHEFPQHYPHPGWVEHDPMDIYAATYAALSEAIAKSGIAPEEIASVGITNQRETVVAWQKSTQMPITNAIVWQCRRTADECERLERDGYSEMVRSKTGLRLDPYFSATKMRWILDNVEGARELAESGDLLFGTIDTWLIYKLTEGRVFVTDRTNASRTMLYNIHSLEWDDELLALFNIPRSSLPEVKSSSEVYGTFECMGATLPLAAIAGDQQAALFGECCFEAGTAKNTYGTGCFLLTHTGTKAVLSQAGLLTTIAATEADCPVEYALEGSVFVGGAVIRWLRDEMKLIHDSFDSEYFARKVDDDGVFVVPAFVGLGAPYWDMRARGTIFGLTAGTGKNHIIRAAIASIAYQTQDVIEAMNRDMGEGSTVDILRADGGAAKNGLLMQLQSDFSGIEVQSFAGAEATATGAAFLAGLAVGFFENRQSLKELIGIGNQYKPKISEAERLKKLEAWHRAVKATRFFTDEAN